MKPIVSGIQATIGFAALYSFHPLLEPLGLGCFCPPLAAVAVLLFCAPGAGASQPKAVIFGHLIAGIVGYCVVTSGVPAAESVASVLTITLMSMFGVIHPPAAAYAYLYALKGMGLKGIFAPGLIGAIILMAVQKVITIVVNLDVPKIQEGETDTKETKKEK
eukprot:640316_1